MPVAFDLIPIHCCRSLLSLSRQAIRKFADPIAREQERKKNRRGKTPEGIPPRRLTR
jgi:hypothetical protein